MYIAKDLKVLSSFPASVDSVRQVFVHVFMYQLFIIAVIIM